MSSPYGFNHGPRFSSVVPHGMTSAPGRCAPGVPYSEPGHCTPPPQPIRGETDACIQALAAELESTLQVSAMEPRFFPPWRSRYLAKTYRGVVAVPAAYDAAAFAGSLTLALAATAISGTSGPLALFLVPTETSPPFSAQLMFNYITDPGHVAVFRTWGLTVQNSVPEAAKIFAEIQGGPNVGSDNPLSLRSGASYEEHEPTLIVVPENARLTVKIQNLDVHSGILFTFGITGWQFPIRNYKDNLKSLLSTPGYGTCER